MKKFLKILLIIAAALVAAVLVIRALMPETEYFLTEEECAQRVVGTWEDPLGDYADHVFNADGTGLLGDIPVTWEIADRHNAGGGIDHDFFYVRCTTEGSNQVYSVSFDYYADIDYLRASPYNIYNKRGTESYGSEDDLYEDTGRDSLYVHRYKVDSWEMVTLDETNWNDYFHIDYRVTTTEFEGYWNGDCLNYVVLKPEYTARAMSLSNPDYTYQCGYIYGAMPYFIEIDKKAKTVELGEWDESGEPLMDVFQFPNERTWRPVLEEPLNPEEWAFGADLDYIFTYCPASDDGRERVYLIEYYELAYAKGTLLLAKTPAER